MDTDSTKSTIESLSDKYSGVNLREDDDGAEKLIIGLDFGTTYSGVAYAFTTQPDKIHVISEWPGAKGKASPKCPTLLKYEGPKDFKWGFELDRTTKERIEGIKLLLDPDQPKPLYVPAINTEAELKRLGKPAMDVASDYISAIFQHAIRKIESKYPRSYLEMVDRQYVLSVPAVWSDKAKDATLRASCSSRTNAARNAGISPVKLIKEPEAAALYTLHEMGNKGLEVGDAIVICDAGGGTVDLISYEIKSLRPFELSELTQATGGLAGSLMLNKRFEEWIKTVVGERAYLDLREQDSYRLAMRTFEENIKPAFRSRDDEEQFVNFPKASLKDDPTKGLQSNTITVNGATLHNIYEPIFTEIDKLVKEQVNAVRLKRMKEKHPKGYDIKAIFLVGGFGSSNYLCENISNTHMDVQVIQPNDAWPAIVRGAVMSQLPSEARVTVVMAPKHYGVTAWNVYDAVLDAGAIGRYSAVEDVHQVEKMTWYIHMGDDLLRSRKVEFPFYRAWNREPSGNDLHFEDWLVESEAAVAPTYPKPGLTKVNCTLKSDLSMLPKDSIKKKSKTASNGKTITWWEVHYKLMVSVDSPPMMFSLVCGAKEYGKIAAEY